MVERIYSFLGIATKAGKLISGEETCERMLKFGKVYLVIVAEDASDNTKRKFTNMCDYRKVDIRYFGSKEMLGKFTGKKIRSVIAITDRGFAGQLKKMIFRGIEHGGV